MPWLWLNELSFLLRPAAEHISLHVWVPISTLHSEDKSAISSHYERRRRYVHRFWIVRLLMLVLSQIRPSAATSRVTERYKRLPARASTSQKEVLLSSTKDKTCPLHNPVRQWYQPEPLQQPLQLCLGTQVVFHNSHPLTPILYTETADKNVQTKQHATLKFMKSSWTGNLWHHCDPDTLAGDFQDGLSRCLLTSCSTV